jgi:hypothetical protein
MPAIFRWWAFSAAASDRLNVLGLPPLRSFGHVELHPLPFLKASETACLYRGEVDKNILTIFATQKAIALCVIEPLHCSLFCHLIFLSLFLNCAEKNRSGEKG